MMVAGIGCRKRISSGEVLAAVDAALAAHECARDALSALAMLPGRSGQSAVEQAANTIDIAFTTPDLSALEAARPRLETRSRRSTEATGFGSAAEAAALAATGPTGRLLGPRLVTGPVTCALAETGDES